MNTARAYPNTTVSVSMNLLSCVETERSSWLTQICKCKTLVNFFVNGRHFIIV